MSEPWPTELFVPRSREELRVSWDDGVVQTMPAEFLRVLTPSAERKGHGARVVVGGKAGVRIGAISAVGRYAVRIAFDDGHSTGLYTFATLREYGEGMNTLWEDYLAELDAVGLARTRPGTAPAPA